MKKMLLIINPIAGVKKASKNLSEIISVFNRANYDVSVYITSCKEDASKAVKYIGMESDIIVCSGGDGTLNETISSMIENKINKPIGYIPSGSTNDFANSLSIPLDVIKASKSIANGTQNEIDVGKFNERYFAYVASFGAFTKTSYSTPQNIKNHWNPEK